MEKENEKVLNALENSTDGVYIEEEPDSINSDGFYKIEVDAPMREAIDNALTKWGAKEESSEYSEKEDKVLKTALEIVMEKTNHLVEDLETNKFKDKGNLKTAIEIAMEKTDNLTEDDSEEVEEGLDDSETSDSEKEENETEEETTEDIEVKEDAEDDLEEEIEEELETKEEDKIETEKIDYEKEIKDFEDSFDVPESDKDMKVRNSAVLRTWDRWKSKLSEKANYSKIDRARNKIEDLQNEYDDFTSKMLQISKEIDTLKESYKEKTSNVKDSEILELLKESQKGKIAEKNKKILELSADRDEIRDEVLDLKIELRDATNKIDEIESNHVDLINSQINSLLENSDYNELIEDAESKKEEIIKLKRRLDMVNEYMENVGMVLENPDMLSKEALKILKEKHKRSSKKAIVVSGAINRKNKELNNSYKAVYKIINKINKLQELKK